MRSSEVRKSPRFQVTVQVQITGVDEAPVLRQGDISTSGLFLEIDREVGSVGSMQRIEVAAEDGSCPVVLLSRVVRIDSRDDFWKGRSIAGVALQFMFVENPGVDLRRTTAQPAAESKALQGLLQRLVRRNAAKHGVQLENWRGSARTAAGERAAELHEMGPRGMVLETLAKVALDEMIRIEMPGPSTQERPFFTGWVAACDPIVGRPDGFRVRVRFGEASPPSDDLPVVAGKSMEDAIEALITVATTLAPPKDSNARELAGELSRISLISVITLCQIERLTGSLLLKNGTSTIRAFLRAGEIVDAIVEGRDVAPRAAMREVVSWPAGSFEMISEPVARADRIGTPTTALIFDLARELDELRRDA